MRTKQMGRDGPEVPVVCFGTWPLGGAYGPVEEAATISTMQAAMDGGLTFIDTAEGYMNAEALTKTIENGEAYYFSRSQKKIWHKGSVSGLTQKIVEMRIDDDQDSIWISVDVSGTGASCHVGYKSCFYRSIPLKSKVNENIELIMSDEEKLFDPDEVYKGLPNPTKL